MRLQITLILMASICSVQGSDINEPGGKLCEDLNAQCVPNNMTCPLSNIIHEGICPTGNTCCDTSDTGAAGGHKIRKQTTKDKDAALPGRKKKCKPEKKCRKLKGVCKAKCASNEKNLKGGCKKKRCKCCIAKPQYCGDEALASQQRIVKGKPIKIITKRQYPWQVGLKDTLFKEYYCGGSFITDKVIMTAAHCFEKKYTDRPCEMKVPDQFYFGIGDFDRNKKPIENILVEKCNVIINKYQCDDPYLNNDIALIKLDKKPTSYVYFHPICWPPAPGSYAGRKATVIGWGGLQGYNPPKPPPGFVQTFPDVLHEAQVTIMNNDDCRLQAPWVTSSMICTSNNNVMEDNKAPCQGDSGGPLFVTKKDGKRVIVGIVSHSRGCASQGHPNVYTRVSKFYPWIKTNIESPSVC